MNSQQLKKDLWTAADNLRANSDLKSSEYCVPVLGLIFLKFADNKYKQHESAILKEYEKLKGGGELFTHRSVVRLMVEIIEPQTGTVFDPACDFGSIFTQIDRAHREFSAEQMANIAIIPQLHIGRRGRFVELIDRYFREGLEKLQETRERVGKLIFTIVGDEACTGYNPGGTKRVLRCL